MILLQIDPSITITLNEKSCRLESPYVKITLENLTPPRFFVLSKLVDASEQEEALSDYLFEKEGPEGLYFCDNVLSLLKKNRLLHYRTPCATLCPMVPNFQFIKKERGNKSFKLSRFAFLHLVGEELVIETPLSKAKIVLHDPKVLPILHFLSQPRNLNEIKEAFPTFSFDFITLLLAIEALEEKEDKSLELWEFHDLLFHSRSRVGRHDMPFGGLYPFRGKVEPLSLIKSPMSLEKIPLFVPDMERLKKEDFPFTDILERRTSIRKYGTKPISLNEVGEFLFRTARIKKMDTRGSQELCFRPYPGGGAIHEIELYLIVNHCEGLPKGIYHYQPLEHALYGLEDKKEKREKVLNNVETATGGAIPQILIVMASRFQRLSWKYRAMAYAASLKHVGVMIQTMYLVGTAMKLSTCAVGSGDADLFSEMIGSNYYEETSVGEFILGSQE